MIITLNNQDYYYQIIQNKANPQWLLLHGFTGSHQDFNHLAQSLPGTIIIPDLLGHGKSITTAPAERFKINQQVADLAQLIKSTMTPPINLWGYSMGGRLALALTLAHPDLIDHLILESSTAGLSSTAERIQRQQHDQKIAEKLRQNGIVAFVNFWESLPLFSSQQKLPPKDKQFIRNQRLQQDPNNLANSLLGMGTGTMPNFWPRLKQVKMPVILLCGRLDSKYQQLTEKMQVGLPSATRFVISNAGHNPHLEQPQTVLSLVLGGLNYS